MDSNLNTKKFWTPAKFASLHSGEYLTGQAGFTRLRLKASVYVKTSTRQDGAAGRIYFLFCFSQFPDEIEKTKSLRGNIN
jgi:hypothetical protein